MSLVGDWPFKGEAYLQNLSTTGCQLVSSNPLEVGMELQLSLTTASHEPDIVIELAKVRWANRECSGLEFLGIDPLERERLRLFLKSK